MDGMAAGYAFLWSVISFAIERKINGSHAFYLAWFRAWELLAGSLLAASASLSAPRWLRESIGVAGLAAIGCALMHPADIGGLPSALLPVIGAAALIGSARSGATKAASILSTRPLVYIGKISYSLYLYHWPIFVFARYVANHELDLTTMAILTAVSIVAASLSYRYIEQPFRTAGKWRRPVIFGAASICMAAGICFGAIVHLGAGLPGRLPAKVSAQGMTASDTNPAQRRCDGLSPAAIDHDAACVIGAPSSAPSFLLLGDSFGDAISPGVAAAALETGRSGFALTLPGCFPLQGVLETIPDGEGYTCANFMNAAIPFIRRHPEIKTVILVARWSTAVTGIRHGSHDEYGLFLTDTESAAAGYAENAHVVDRGLRRLLTSIGNRRVIVGAYIPEQSVNVPRYMALQTYFGRTTADPGIARAEFDARQKQVREILNALSISYPNLKIADIGAHLCDTHQCHAIDADGRPLYVDDNYLSRTEAVKIHAVFSAAFL